MSSSLGNFRAQKWPTVVSVSFRVRRYDVQSAFGSPVCRRVVGVRTGVEGSLFCNDKHTYRQAFSPRATSESRIHLGGS